MDSTGFGIRLKWVIMGRSGRDRHKGWRWGGVPPTPFLLGLWIRVHLLQAGVGPFSRASALRVGGMWAAILLVADCSGISLETLSPAETWRGEWEASLWSQAQLSPGTKPRGWSHGTMASSYLVLQWQGQGLCDWPSVREMPAFCKPTVHSHSPSAVGDQKKGADHP